MGTLKNILVGGLIFGAGYMVGNKPTKLLSNYSVSQNKTGIELFVKDINKTYQVQKIGNELYVGDAKHHLQGMMILTAKDMLKGNESDSLINEYISNLDTSLKKLYK